MMKREVFLEIVQRDKLVHLKPDCSVHVLENQRHYPMPRAVTDEPLSIMDAGGGGPREPLHRRGAEVEAGFSRRLKYLLLAPGYFRG